MGVVSVVKVVVVVVVVCMAVSGFALRADGCRRARRRRVHSGEVRACAARAAECGRRTGALRLDAAADPLERAVSDSGCVVHAMKAPRATAMPTRGAG
jgi:hypothetical protein